MRRFRTCSLDQPLLLAPSLHDWLPESHLARFIAEVVNQLNLDGILSAYWRKNNRGAEGYHPEMLTRLLLYGYATGLTSSRRIEKATYDNVAFRFLAADQHPDHDTIASFRQQHLEELAKLFVEALQLCRRAGLVKLGNVAIDGTKLKANAGWGRGRNHARLSEEEQKLTELVKRLMEEAQQTDAEDDARFGKGKQEESLPEELASAKQRLECIQKVKQELEEEAKQRLEEAKRDYPPRKRGPIPKQGPTQTALSPEEQQVREKLKSRLKKARQNAKQPKRYYNFTDPDSRMMMDKGQRHLIYGYNAQAAVDSHVQVIVSAELTQDETDYRMLLPMVAAVEQAMGEKPAAITADAGYWDTENIRSEALKGMLALVNPDGGKKKDKKEEEEKRRANPTMERMRELLKTDEAKALYKQRKTIVEPVFGQIKQQRGIREFRLRGIKKTKAEWQLICLTHNLLKLYHYDWAPQRSGKRPVSRAKGKSEQKTSAKPSCGPKAETIPGIWANGGIRAESRALSAFGQRNGWYRCGTPKMGTRGFIPTDSCYVPEIRLFPESRLGVWVHTVDGHVVAALSRIPLGVCPMVSICTRFFYRFRWVPISHDLGWRISPSGPRHGTGGKAGLRGHR